MLKKTIFSLSVMALSGAALSAPVANIKVTGDIKPPTCMVNGGNNDILFDYGKISPTVIPQSTNYQLPVRTATIEILCDAQTFLTFTATDNYTIDTAESAIKDEVFGLVDASDTTKEIGRVGYAMTNLTVDNKAAYLGRSGTKTATAPWWNDSLIREGIMAWTSVGQPNVDDLNELKLIPGEKFNATISSGTHVAGGNIAATAILSKDKLSAGDVNITSGLDYISQVTLTFNFGV